MSVFSKATKLCSTMFVGFILCLPAACQTTTQSSISPLAEALRRAALEVCVPFLTGDLLPDQVPRHIGEVKIGVLPEVLPGGCWVSTEAGEGPAALRELVAALQRPGSGWTDRGAPRTEEEARYISRAFIRTQTGGPTLWLTVLSGAHRR